MPRSREEVLFIGWVGLRGAVPIVLATFPVLAGAPGGDRIFHLVFFIVVMFAPLFLFGGWYAVFRSSAWTLAYREMKALEGTSAPVITPQ